MDCETLMKKPVTGIPSVIRTDPLWTCALAMVALAGCSGPQPLKMAINPADEQAYVAALNAANGDARAGFAAWMAAEHRAADAAPDEALSETRNPFDAHKDAQAVSRGAVLYKLHCARCHGDDARGRGPSTLADFPATDFHTFGKRFAATLHRGAPRKWFHVIRDGSGDRVDYPDGPSTAMPPFGDKLAREQTWLLITYLQSLDMHARERGGGGVR